MSTAVLRAVFAQSWAKPGRRLLVALVVVVASAFAAASAMLAGAASTTIVRELAGTPQAASLVVQANPTPQTSERLNGVPADVEQQVLATPGVAAVSSSSSAVVALSLPGQPGDGAAWTAVGSSGGPLGRYPVVTGRLPADPGEAAISADAARRTGLQVGSPLSFVGAGGAQRDFTVSGLVTVRAQPLSTVVLQPEVAAELTDADPSQLDVIAAPGIDPAALRTTLLTDLGGDDLLVRDAAEVRSSELSAAFGGGLAAIFAALGVFGSTAALAAVLTTFCVFGVVTARQRRTVMLLRGVGASRPQVLTALLADAALTGLVAGILGMALSLGLVQLVRLVVVRTSGESLPTPPVSAVLVAATVLGAVVITLLAAVGPTVRVSGLRPVSVDAPEAGPRQVGRRTQRLLLGLVLAAMSVVAAMLGPAETDPQRALILVAVAGVLAFGAALAVGPVLLPAIAWLIGMLLLPLSRLPGRLAVRSALRSPHRSSTTAAALVLASLLLTVVLVGLQSLSQSVEERIAARFPASVVALASNDQPLSPDLAQRITDLPESGVVAPVQSAIMNNGTGPELTFSAVDTAAFPPLLRGAVDAGSLADLAPGTIALDRAQAEAWKVGLNTPLTLAGPDGPVQLKVVAIYRSSGVLDPVTVNPADMPRMPTGGWGVREVLADPATGVDVEALRGAVATAVGPDPTAQVIVPADFRAELNRAVTLTRTVALGLVGATVLVALCGVAVALALSTRERSRESATLRALGLTPGQIVASLGLESALLGFAGVLVGTGLGVLFGVLAVVALREPAVVPLDAVLLGSGSLVLVAIIAGTLPAVGAAHGSAVPSTVD